MSLPEAYHDRSLPAAERLELLNQARADALMAKKAHKAAARSLLLDSADARACGDAEAVIRCVARANDARKQQHAAADRYKALRLEFAVIYADQREEGARARAQDAERAAAAQKARADAADAQHKATAPANVGALVAKRRATFKPAATSRIGTVEAQLKGRAIPVDPTIDDKAVANALKKKRAAMAARKRAGTNTDNTDNTDNRNNEKAQE